MAEEINYTVRVSRRARRLRIVVRPDMCVEVVLPHGLPHHHADHFVCEKRVWINRSLERFSHLAESRENSDNDPFPRHILLEAIGLKLPVTYTKSDSDHVRVKEEDEGLQLSGHVDDGEKVRLALHRWLKRKAKERLPQMVENLSRQYGYQHKKVTIRLQKSRWGSCSKAGNISLNAKLLFLPSHLMRHVMLHELAHLKHLNHSPHFWAEVARSDRDYLSHVREMRSVSRHIPGWVE